MSSIAILAVLFCCILMFVVKRENKAGLMIVGTLVFTTVRIPALPFHSANYLLPVCFLLSEFNQIKAYIRSSKGTTVWKLMGVATVLVFLTLLTSPHLRNFENIKGFLQGELFFKYFALLYVYWAFSTEESIKPTLRITFIGLLVLTFFGILNYLSKSAIFITDITSGTDIVGMGDYGNDAGQLFTYSDRFRVQSMFLNPFDYGYICILMLLLHVYGYIKGYERKWKLLAVVACSVFGVVSCGCRTNIFCCLVGVSIFFLLAFKLGKTLRIALFMVCAAVLSYQFVPSLQETVDNMLTMFDKNSDVGGSSMEMRTMQYAAVLYHVKDNPLFGCGYGYFVIDMGWGKGAEFLKDSRLFGLEGVAMGYILERGFVGLFLYIAFYASILVSFFRNRKTSMVATAFGISVVCTYLFFANMTGELLSVYPTLLLLGYVFKVVDYQRLRATISGGVIDVINYLLAHTLCRNLKTAKVWA